MLHCINELLFELKPKIYKVRLKVKCKRKLITKLFIHFGERKISEENVESEKQIHLVDHPEVEFSLKSSKIIS